MFILLTETDEDLQTSWKRNHGNQNNTKAGLFLSSEDESFSSSESEKNDFDLLVSISNKTPNNPTTNPILVLGNLTFFPILNSNIRLKTMFLTYHSWT